MTAGLLLGWASLGWAAGGVRADSAPEYAVSLDTTALAGTSGTLLAQFNPGGPDALPATVTLDDLVCAFDPVGGGAATFGTATVLTDLAGAATGASLTNDLTSAANGFTLPVIYGTPLTFDVSFAGPALTPGAFPPSAGSALAFSLLDGAGDPVLTTDASGTVLTFDLNADGTLTPTVFSPGAGDSPVAMVVPLSPPPAVPEPAPVLLLLTGLGASGLSRGMKGRQGRRDRRQPIGHLAR